MSQRTISVNEEIIVNLKLKVKINSFSNHDGFKPNQIESAINEFKNEITNELYHKLEQTYYQELLESVDYVDYDVDRLD